MKTVTTIVTIGKSRQEVSYTFFISDFIRIEDGVLLLEREKRRIRIVEEYVKQTIIDLNKYNYEKSRLSKIRELFTFKRKKKND